MPAIHRPFVRALLSVLTLVGVLGSMASAQTGSTTGSIGGTVVNQQGVAVPDAKITIEGTAILKPFTAITQKDGAFLVASLQPGNYTVTVEVKNFKKVVAPNVELKTADARQLNFVLEPGIEETVTVLETTALVQTAETKVEAGITADQIASLPLITKNALYFATFLPGVNTNNLHSQRFSTVVGLPGIALSTTLDGVRISDPSTGTTDPFFMEIRPQTDLIESVTVTEAASGADSSAQGAVKISFVTRSGSNRTAGSAYEYFRNQALNTNSFFNTAADGKVSVDQPKTPLTLNQYGVRQGGPIVLPHLYDGRGKAFYFFNYEEYRQPSSVTRMRTVLNPSALNGTFLYSCKNGTCGQSVNLLAIGAAKSLPSSVDPTVVAMLNEISREEANCSICLAGVKPNPDQNTSAYTFNSPQFRLEHLPGARVDLNLSSTQRLTATYAFQKVTIAPDVNNQRDAAFPGGAVHSSQYYFRNSGSATWRSTLRSNIVNEAGWGFLWAPGYFSGDLTASQFANAFPEGFAGGQAFNVALPYVSSLTVSTTNQSTTALDQARNGSSWAVHDTVSWLTGHHSLSAGVTFSQASSWLNQFLVVPTVFMGLDQTDPAFNVFNTTANVPGATQGELGSARNLFALLTGRVTTIAQNSAYQPDGTYAYGGASTEMLRQHETGLFVEDQWRLRSNLTFNLGVRYELQFPVYPLTSIYGANVLSDLCGQSGFGTPAPNAVQALRLSIPCNLGNPGVLNAPGQMPSYKQYVANTGLFSMDKDNVGPSLGMAWQPQMQHGFLRALLGDPSLATVRVSWTRSFNQGGLADYLPTLENAPGLTVNSNRSVVNGNFTVPTLLTPALQAGALGPPGTCQAGAALVGCLPSGISYPTPISFQLGAVQYDPHFRTSYSDTYSAGIQRSLSRDSSIEFRYVGTKNHRGPLTLEFGEADILNSKFGASFNFLSEFKRAQQNLAINIQNNMGATFAYNGLDGQFPLPIMLASFNGLAGCGTTDGCPGAATPANYLKGPNASNWTNNSYLQALSMFLPDISKFAGLNTSTSLFGNTALRNNGVAAGLPINFWVMNPDVLFNDLQASVAYTKYNSVQVLFTRRLSRGLQISANYVWQMQFNSANEGSIYRALHLARTSGASAPPPNAFKILTSWDVPVGRGQRFGSDMPGWLDGVIGNWKISLTGRVQNGELVDIGDVKLVGLTLHDLRQQFHYYRNLSDGLWYFLPQALIQNTARAFSTDAMTATGYVACTGSNAFNCGGPDPSQPYLAPPSSKDCTRIYQGDCGIRDQFIVAPLFTRFDFLAKKRFRLGQRGSFEVEIDVFNLFNAIDFNPVTLQFGVPTSQSGWQVPSAYSDVSNTLDPGGRLGQLVFRVSW